MQANTDKFQAVPVGKKTHEKNIEYDLNCIHITCDEEVELKRFKKKTGKHLNRLGKLTIYYSFMFYYVNFSYCPLTWHFCSEQNTAKIEKIQEHAFCFIYNDYTSSYNSLLEQSKLPSIKTRRMRTIAWETSKVINK